MAEIKSTMEMVLERAAKMADSGNTAFDDEELQRTGMRLAAEFLKKRNLTCPRNWPNSRRHSRFL